MSKRLIQDLNAGISRRDWWAVETAANRLRDEVEQTIAILAGTNIGSLPNDYQLSRLAADAQSAPVEQMRVTDEMVLAACRAHAPQFERLDDDIKKYAVEQMRAALLVALDDQELPYQCDACGGVPGYPPNTQCGCSPKPVDDNSPIITEGMIAAAPELLECLRELYAIVRGECPSLLNEDSGGNAELELAIIDAIAKAEDTTHA